MRTKWIIYQKRSKDTDASPAGFRESAGLSLVEVTLALGILAYALTAMMQVSGSVLVNGSINRHRTEAMLKAKTVMGEIRTLRDSGASIPQDILEAFPPGPIQENTPTLKGELVTVSYDNPNATPLFVTVTVQWTDMRGRVMTEPLSTVIEQD